MKRRAASIAVLINLLGASWGVTRKPSDIKLKWLQDEVKDDHKLPHMEITFADGSKDEVFLNTDPENDCFFHGKLKSDIESTVEVDGCKNNVETIVICSRLVPCRFATLLLENGVTYSIDPSEGREGLNQTDSVEAEAFDAGAKWTGGALPQGVVAKIHVRYDESLVKQYGSRQEAEKGVKAIIQLSRPWFVKGKRGLVMDVEIEVMTLKYYDGTIPHPGVNGALKLLKGKGAKDDEGYPTAWFKANDCLNPPCGNTVGLGHRPAFCYPGRFDLGGLFIIFHF